MLDIQNVRELFLESITKASNESEKNYEALEFLGDSMMNFFVIMEKIMTKSQV
jgi:dsRNA-specific ribonuclease